LSALTCFKSGLGEKSWGKCVKKQQSRIRLVEIRLRFNGTCGPAVNMGVTRKFWKKNASKSLKNVLD
jgi:hypothetical protein